MLKPIPTCAAVAGLCLAVSACTSAPAGHAMVASPRAERIYVCHGYGCSFRTRLDLGASDLARFSKIMAGGKSSAKAERAAISRADQYFEKRAQAAIGVRDDPRSEFGAAHVRGQMDCIDESTNTHNLLGYLDRHGLLRHHKVRPTTGRGFLLDGRYPHATAVIEDDSGVKWAVDSWYAPMGGAPDIIPLSEWMPRGRFESGALDEG